MARCHQWHNIPWQALVDCLEMLHYRNNRGPTHLWAKPCSTEEELRLQYKKIWHFTSRMEATIADFAATERSKYDLGTILKREKVFDDEFRSDILTPEYQSLDFWRFRKEQPSRCGYDGGDEAGVIKELFNVNNMEAILLLVYTGVGIQDLEVRTHIAGFGFFHLAEDCLQIYVFLNHLIASGDMESPHRWHSPWKRAVQHACCSRDLGDVQQRVLKSYLTGNASIRVGFPDDIGGLFGFSDYRGMDDMLKYCFRILYQYKMVSEEIHGKSTPRHLIPSPLHSLWQYLRFSSFECKKYSRGHSPLCTFGHCQLPSE